MTTAEALAQWPDACAVAVLGETVWLNGNRQPLADVLKHFADATVEETEFPSPRSDWKAVVKVVPKDEKQQPFYLAVE